MKSRQIALIAFAGTFLSGLVCGQVAGRDYPIRPVPFTEVRIAEGSIASGKRLSELMPAGGSDIQFKGLLRGQSILADLAGGVDEVAHLDEGDVVRRRGRGVGKGDAEFGEAFLDQVHGGLRVGRGEGSVAETGVQDCRCPQWTEYQTYLISMT